MVTISTRPLDSDWCVCTFLSFHWSKVLSQGPLLKTIRVVISIPIAHLPRSVRIEASSPDVIGLLPVSSPLVGWCPPLCLPSLPLVVTDLSLPGILIAAASTDLQLWPGPPWRAETTNQQEEKGNYVTVRGGGFLILS